MVQFGLLAAAAPPVSQEQFAHLATVVAVCWWALCFAIIFFMQCGFLLLEAGSVRAKNAAHVAAKVLAHTAIATFCFWLVASLVKGFHVASFGSALLGSIVVTVVSWILTALISDSGRVVVITNRPPG